MMLERTHDRSLNRLSFRVTQISKESVGHSDCCVETTLMRDKHSLNG